MRKLCVLTVVLLSLRSQSAHAEDTAATLRANLGWQIALDRVGFSPGVLDGKVGRKTELATREFQRVRGLPATGHLDAATRDALDVRGADAIASYVVTAEDAGEVGPAPKDWLARSRLTRLGYESLAAGIAERFHCSLGLLGRLNPGKDLSHVRPGDVLAVPAISVPSANRVAESLEIDLHEKIIRAMDVNDRLVGLLHCSIAKDKERLPTGVATVTVISENPDYTFDPKMWPEVKGIDRKLTIPPGPRNPVGKCWIGLSLPGYGIHGSPNPELIGKTGSHGCFRLTNWDAVRLGKMLRVGAKVRFVGGPQLAAASKRQAPL